MPYTPQGIFYANTSTAMSVADITQTMAESVSDNLSILQVVQTSYANTTTNSSITNYVDSGLTATITPMYSTSKILILVNMPFQASVTSNDWSGADFKIIRNTTDIAVSTPLVQGMYRATSGTPIKICQSLSLTHTDSPASTSATTYKVAGKINGGSGTPSAATLSMNYAQAAAASSIVLMEIKQ